MQPLTPTQFPDAQVHSHPAPPSLTSIPECLLVRFDGYHLSWQVRSDKVISMLRHVQIHPVFIEDLDASLMEQLRREGYTRESLKEGMIWNGDCVLCYQPLEARRVMQARTAEVNRRRHSTAAQKDSLDAELQRLSELTGHRTGQKLIYETPYSQVELGDHVATSKVLRDPQGHRATAPPDLDPNLTI